MLKPSLTFGFVIILAVWVSSCHSTTVSKTKDNPLPISVCDIKQERETLLDKYVVFEGRTPLNQHGTWFEHHECPDVFYRFRDWTGDDTSFEKWKALYLQAFSQPYIAGIHGVYHGQVKVNPAGDIYIFPYKAENLQIINLE